MDIPSDFSELLGLLNENNVDYLIVGGYALAVHGAPRYTGDLDILVRPDYENAQRIIDALQKFGFGSLGLTVDDFLSPDNVIQLGYPPIRIDIITSLTAVSTEEAFSGRIEGKYSGLTVYYIGREQFITNKRAIGRKRDIADVEAIDEAADENG